MPPLGALPVLGEPRDAALQPPLPAAEHDAQRGEEVAAVALEPRLEALHDVSGGRLRRLVARRDLRRDPRRLAVVRQRRGALRCVLCGRGGGRGGARYALSASVSRTDSTNWISQPVRAEVVLPNAFDQLCCTLSHGSREQLYWRTELEGGRALSFRMRGPQSCHLKALVAIEEIEDRAALEEHGEEYRAEGRGEDGLPAALPRLLPHPAVPGRTR